jgi:hypothetical protein
MLGLNLSQDTSYPKVFDTVPQFLRENSWIVTGLGDDFFLPNP